jgi:hypothetical protein
MMKLARCILLLTVAFIASANAQTSDDLRRRLDAVPVTEVYQLDAGLSVTISYDGQRQACEIQIDWKQVAGSNQGFIKVEELAKKLVPVGARGRLLGMPRRLMPVMDCCENWAYEYERLTMTDAFTGDNRSIGFTFRGRQCVVSPPRKPFVFAYPPAPATVPPSPCK